MTELQYTAEHEWVSVEDDPSTGSGQRIATVGITPYAADKLGDIVFVDLAAVGTVVAPGKVAGEIESTKSVGELFAPVAGEVVELNGEVIADPSLVNADPFAAWLMRIRVDEVPELLSADEYAALTA